MAKNIKLGIFAVAAGTADVITATYTPATAALYNGLYKQFRASGANTVVAPTFNVDGLGAKPIVKKGGNALVSGDIAGAGHVCEVSYNSTSEKWELLNPASDLADTFWEAGAGTGSLKDKRATSAGFANSTAVGTGAETTADGQTALGGQIIFNEYGSSGEKLLKVDANGIVNTTTHLPNPTTATTQSAGDNSTKVATTAYVKTAVDNKSEFFGIACSDETTVLAAASTSVPVATMHIPYSMTLTRVYAGLRTAGTGAAVVTVDIHVNGTSIMTTTKILFTASQKLSADGVLTTTALAAGDYVEIFLDQRDTDNVATGLKTYLVGHQ